MTDEALKTLAKVLKSQGHSITSARRQVIEALWGKEPQTTKQLTDSLSGKIDRASLYRTLKLFEQLGLTQRVYIGWKYSIELSDLLAHHHHHIYCMKCGKIQSLQEETIEELINKLAEQQGMVAKKHQLEIQGYCLDCADSL